MSSIVTYIRRLCNIILALQLTLIARLKYFSRIDIVLFSYLENTMSLSRTTFHLNDAALRYFNTSNEINTTSLHNRY